jgi:hypothetical protein
MSELEITCPRTQLPVPTGIAVDLQSLVLSWALKLEVKCPALRRTASNHCREAYVDGILREIQGDAIRDVMDATGVRY